MKLEGFSDSSAILRSGIYALCAKGQVIYVGKSKAMIARINAHRTKWIDKRKGRNGADWIPIPALLFDEIHVLAVAPQLLDLVEAEMINRFKPKYNIQLKTTAKVSAPIAITIAGKILNLNAQRVVVERRI